MQSNYCVAESSRGARKQGLQAILSTHILFLLETTESAAFGSAVDTAAADLATRAATRSRRVSTQWLTPASPAAALGEPAA